MSSKTRVEYGGFPVDFHQVFYSLDNIDNIGNAGPSLSDVFGYSKEFEHQLALETQPDNFKITNLLYGSENDFDSLQLMEPKNQNFNMFNQHFVPSQESYVMQELAPIANQVHEHDLSYQEQVVDNQDISVPLPPPLPAAVIQTSQYTSHLQWSFELHAGFLGAIKQLGGLERATPENILYLMNVRGLTLDHVKGHLQAYQQGNYFDQESTEVSEIARSAPVAPHPEGPSEPRTANKQPKRKRKAKKGNNDIIQQCEEQIERFQGAENNYMDLLIKSAGQKLGNFGEVNDVGRMTYFPFASNFPPVEGCSQNTAICFPTFFL